MPIVANQAQSPATIHTDLGAIFVSLELSRSTWLISSLSPGGGEKMSKHSVCSGDFSGLLERFRNLREKALSRTAQQFPIIVIQEAGLDGFWIHRVLIAEGIESHVVDPASIATSRRRRRVVDTFRRAHLGVETQRQWSDLAMARTTPALFGLFSLVTLWAADPKIVGSLRPRSAAWYHKRELSFSDAIAAIRKLFWSAPSFSMSRHPPDSVEIPAALWERLTEALCYAA